MSDTIAMPTRPSDRSRRASYAAILTELEASSLSLVGYDPFERPDIVRLATRHPRVARLVLEPRWRLHMGAHAITREIAPGRYEIRCDEAVSADQGLSAGHVKQQLVLYRRARFTLAHELGHIALWTALDSTKATTPHSPLLQPDVERLCDRFAQALLLPRPLLQRLLAQLPTDGHPADAFAEIMDATQVNRPVLLARLAETGLAGEHAWFAARFRLAYNPAKRDGRKWRLVPGSIVLPRGLRRSLAPDSSSRSKHLGFNFVGLDTLGFVPPTGKSWSVHEIRALFARYGKLDVCGDEAASLLPWWDLNSKLTPSGRQSRSRLRLHHEPSCSSSPVAPGLLRHSVVLSERARDNNRRLRLTAREPMIFRSSLASGASEDIIVMAGLMLVPRH